MASRQEEKERRRKERIAAEQAAAAAAARKQRLRVAGAAGAAVVAVLVVVLALSSGTGGESNAPSNSQLARLKRAAAAAGCKLLDSSAHYSPPGQKGGVYTHVQGSVKYATNPPTYGNHNPTPASDGDYVGAGTPPKEMLVHALEHGRIEYQYKPGTPKAVTDQLERVFNESSGSYGPGQLVLLFQNETKMPYAVAAVAWTHILGCQAFTPKVAQAFRDFRTAFTFKGPEKIAPTGE